MGVGVNVDVHSGAGDYAFWKREWTGAQAHQSCCGRCSTGHGDRNGSSVAVAVVDSWLSLTTKTHNKARHPHPLVLSWVGRTTVRIGNYNARLRR